MKRLLAFSGSLLLSGMLFSIWGQTPQPTAEPTPDNDVVKITTKLVQMDLIVIDKDGNQVRDLKREDFELLQDGKAQEITNFAYITRPAPTVSASPDESKAQGKTAVPPPPRISAADAGRIITFIVDNAPGSFEGVNSAKVGIENFIRDQMLPTDLVAIYQTQGGSSLFQQYTNDKTLLLAAAKKIRWYPSPLSGDSVLDEPARTDSVKPETDAEQRISDNRQETVESTRVLGALGLIRYIVQGLKQVPGRKIVFLMSDGIPLRGSSERGNAYSDVIESLREVTDLANRSSTVIYPIDSRGLEIPNMIEARDSVAARDDALATTKLASDRSRAALAAQDGLVVLAKDTGGTFYHNGNKLEDLVKRALATETGYYLLAYEPADDSFKDKKYNTITARVNRPDLRVITRAGYIGRVDEPKAPRQRNADSDLYDALVSPLPVPGIGVRLSAYFGNSATAGNYVRTYFYVDGDQLVFTDEPDGVKKLSLDVVAVTLSDKNKVIDEFDRAHTETFTAASAEIIKRNGIIYSADVPIKNPGTYTFRVAIRDGASRSIGTASQTIQIPDLKKNELYLSGLTITGVDKNGKFLMPGAATAKEAISLPYYEEDAAIRRFHAGEAVAYAFSIYNAHLDKATGQPKLSLQMNLYRDGVIASAGKPDAVELHPQDDLSRINDFQYIRLSPKIQPGNYTLQIIVRDQLSDKKNAVSSQWIDFEIVP